MRSSLFAAVITVVLALPGLAAAADRDETALASVVEKVLAGEATPNPTESQRRVRALIDKCKSCSGRALGRAHAALGILALRAKDTEDAKRAFSDALTYDPLVAVSEPAFADAKKAWVAMVPEQDDTRRAGWILKGAYATYKQSVEAALAEKWAKCIDKAKASLVLEENVHPRMQLAQCEEKTSKIVDALKDNGKALERARAIGDADLIKAIQERVTLLVPRLGHIHFERPAEVVELQILFDDRPIPEARLVETFTVDPGPHRIHAEGMLRGARVFTDESITIAEGEIATAKIKLKPVALTRGQLECMIEAKSQEDILKCLPQEQKALVAHASLETSAYSDNFDVNVLSPAVRASVASPIRGWNVGASYVVDVVSAASPDVIATASPRFQDVRHAAAVTGGYKPGDYGAQVAASYSQERDYISRTVGLTAIADVREKSATPTLGYAFTWNTIGRAGTDYDVFSRRFDVHDITAGSTFILGANHLLVAGASVGFEDGDQSKPYRYIPLFEPGVTVPVGASVADVNRARLPTKTLEQLPLDRQRFSLTARYIRKLGPRTTIRLEERLYRDTWEIMATTTDARYIVDIGRFRVGPHVHVHAQTPAKFYRRIYGGILDRDGFATLPMFRTTDRELSPMFGITLGGLVRCALNAPADKLQLAAFASVDGLYNHYLNSLYVTDRVAAYGTIGIEADFE